jgi:hypothetical protein
MRLVFLLAIGIALALPAPGHAQATQPDLPRGDVTFLTGWLRADRDELAPQVYRTWYSEWFGSAGAGVYWTEHLKTEVDAGGAGEHRLFGSERMELGAGVARYIYSTHYVSSRTVSVTQSWQFLHNAWVHPFVGVGLDLDWQRRRTESETFLTTPTTNFRNDPERLPDETERSVKARAVFSTGFKAYVTRRTFLRTDMRMGIRTGLDTFRWRFGGGFDF